MPAAVTTNLSPAHMAWSCVAALFMSPQNHGRFAETAADIGLNPGAMKALMTLHTMGELPMGALGSELHCDASMVTQMVDALEAKGYAERVASPTDRRVKLVRITKPGVRARDRALDRLSVPPAAITALSERDQESLARILTKALALADPPMAPPGNS